jgi:hypothetical protein
VFEIGQREEALGDVFRRVLECGIGAGLLQPSSTAFLNRPCGVTDYFSQGRRTTQANCLRDYCQPAKHCRALQHDPDTCELFRQTRHYGKSYGVALLAREMLSPP